MNNNSSVKESVIAVENEQEKNIPSTQDKLNNPPVYAIRGEGMTFNSNLKLIREINGTEF